MNTLKAQDIWEATLGELQLQLTRPNYETWLRDTIGLDFEGDRFVVGVPTPFAAEWLGRRMYSLIQKTLIGIIQREQIEILFRVHQRHPLSTLNNDLAKTHTEETFFGSPSKNYWHAKSNGLGNPWTFNPKYTFDSFIVGSCNQLAYAAAQGVAKEPGHSYNPLFLYAGVGLGKTHLLQAIGREALSKNLEVLYINTEEFTNDFVTSIRERKTEDFRSKYRNVDVLLIDDIHFIIGREQTQEGFFHTFNDLHNANRQIVITSDRPPKALTLLEDRLRSRFEWGLIADIQPPDFETRLAILRFKAEQMKVELGQESLDFIARKVRNNIRELEGSLNRVVAYARLSRSPISVELAAKALTDITSERRRPITPEAVINAVALHFNLDPEKLRGKKRNRQIALARQVAMYLLREEAQQRLAQIGRELGGRAHNSALHGYEKIANEINVSPKLRQDILDIREILYQETE